jgi:hypothetical protein
MAQQPILHHAEELGQARQLTSDEVWAWVRLSACVFGAACVLSLVIVNNIRLFADMPLTWRSLLFDPLSLGALAASLAFLGNFVPFLVNSLRSERWVETYAPPQVEPQAETSHPPILVRPYKGDPYTVGQPEAPALPGREPLQLTPPVVAEILQAVVEQYGGEWSRRKLTRLRVDGQKVSRSVYEELTRWLHSAGVLLQTPQGGYNLPPDIEQFDDLRVYFPSLPTPGRAGRQPGDRANGGYSLPSPAGGEVGSLAERRRQRWLECDCNVEAYRNV